MSILHKRKNDFERVYNEYADILFRLSLSYVKSRADAEDVVQDTFVSYINSSPYFHDEEHRRAWLFKVAVNKCRDMHRRQSIRQSVSLDEVGHMATEEDLHGESAELFAALRCLPQKYRAAVILHYLEGYSVSETAKCLSASESAVKMRLSRGRQMLKNLLEKEV